MDFVLSAITFIFVALILALAITIGFSLLLWFLAFGIMFSIILIIRQRWARWQFLRENDPDNGIIEGSYTEITDQHNP